MKKLLPVMLVVFAGVGLSSMAFANQPPRQPPTFEELDVNGDGLLSEDEVKGPLKDDFAKFDVDGDGFLSQDEMPEPRQKKRS
ncbi:EF-hand domain-containing protein [Vibrio agarivorans]|uniref:EF-hand domain-containing protein n=1 Tax=Vibrio agarivorans TaxID=153622 RepID=UPI002232B470|nr:EF-hand domain-containing protein [Vibrio agarivorans]